MRYWFIFIFVCFNNIVYAQNFEYIHNDTTTLVEYKKGKQWAYKTAHDMTVGMSVQFVKGEYGKYYQVLIYVQNNNEWTFVFNPDRISAVIETKRDKKIPLLVYSYDRYMNKVKHHQAWEMAAGSFAVGINTGLAGHKTAYVNGWSPSTGFYSGTVSYYDSGAATSAAIQGGRYLDYLEEKNEYKRNTHSLNYLQKTSVRSGEYLYGHINIKRKKGNFLYISIPFGGSNYNFNWRIKNK